MSRPRRSSAFAGHRHIVVLDPRCLALVLEADGLMSTRQGFPDDENGNVLRQMASNGIDLTSPRSWVASLVSSRRPSEQATCSLSEGPGSAGPM
jgi:hypothetical protein